MATKKTDWLDTLTVEFYLDERAVRMIRERGLTEADVRTNIAAGRPAEFREYIDPAVAKAADERARLQTTIVEAMPDECVGIQCSKETFSLLFGCDYRAGFELNGRPVSLHNLGSTVIYS